MVCHCYPIWSSSLGSKLDLSTVYGIKTRERTILTQFHRVMHSRSGWFTFSPRCCTWCLVMGCRVSCLRKKRAVRQAHGNRCNNICQGYLDEFRSDHSSIERWLYDSVVRDVEYSWRSRWNIKMWQVSHPNFIRPFGGRTGMRWTVSVQAEEGATMRPLPPAPPHKKKTCTT